MTEQSAATTEGIFPQRSGRWVTLAAAVVMSLGLAASAFGKGGDYVTPFPITDPLPARQEAKSMAVDPAGNIIVAGYTNSGGMNNDYLVTKFKADGSGVAWRATFDKSGGDDQATAVAVDRQGNIIVTGTVWNAASTDIHTIKYAADGTLLWQHTFSGAAGGSDIATSLAVDGDDNIYVAGYSANSSGNDDFLILKYPAAGTAPVWTEIYNSPYNSNDRIMAIAAGTSGIAVTGASSKGGMDFDILTRSYTTEGALVWEQRKASTGSGDDRGMAVRTDPSGNVIVSGYLSNGSNSDIYIAKYGAAAPGTLAWETTYNGGSNDEPRALRVDGSGDIFVTGYTYTYSGNEDFYTARYRGTDGTKLWSAIYNSGADFTDIPVDLVVKEGDTGGVFVVGYTVTSSNENITTLKYRKSNGTLLWQQSFNGAANRNDRPVGIGLAPSGNVCVAGWTDTAANLFDTLAISYDHGPLDPPTGLVATATSNSTITLAWEDNSTNESGFTIERKLGEAGAYAQIATVAADVTAYSDASLTPNSYYYYRVRASNTPDGDSAYSNESHALTKVITYDPPSWVYQYNGADNREDEAVGITTGSDDHPVVTGYSDLTEEGVAGAYSFDYLTIKLNRTDKSVTWKARYDSGDGGTDMAAGLVLDNNGDAVVTGTAYLSGGSDKSDDLYTIKYSSASHTDPAANPPMAWSDQYGTQAGIDQATAIQASRDGANNIVVIGHGINATLDEDMFIIKYRPDGTRPWAPIVYAGPAQGNDYPSAVAFDTAGDIFITGSTENAAGDFDIYTAKYSGATGALVWSDIYAGAGNGDDHGLALAIDRKGDLYVTGYAVNAGGNEEWLTLKYAGADSVPTRELWRAVHNGPAAPVNGNDRGTGVALDPIDGAVIVAGTSYVTATDSDFHLIRYNAADGAVIWERNFDRPGRYDYVTGMAVDSSGYIYLTGNSRSGPDTDPAYDDTSDILSLIYDFEGTFLSASVYDGGRQDEARAIAANYRGEAFSAGVTLNASNPDYLVVKQKNDYILVPAPLTLVPPPDYQTMTISWRANTPGTQFQVDRTPAPVLPTSVWTPVTTAPAGMTSFTDTGLATNTGYCYRIYAFSGSLNSRTIEQCATTTLPAPILAPPVVDSTTQISLSWSQIAGNSGYRIERKTGSGGSWAELAVKGSDVTSHTDSGLSAGTTYYYRVSSISPSGYSLPSNEQSAPTRPVAPTLNTPTSITNTQMALGWNSVTGATGYTLQFKIWGGSYADAPGCVNVAATSCTATGLAAPNSYSFRVKAVNSGGDSSWSNETSGTAALAVPTLAAPTAITTTAMTLSWTNPVVPGANVTSYTLEYREGAGGTFGPSGCPLNTNLSCTVSGLTPNRTYYFHVKATNAAGDSAWSTEQSGTTPLPAPTFTGAAGVTTSQIDLSWAAVPEATGYTIQQAACSDSTTPSTCRGTSGSYGGWSDKATGVTTTTYSATGLSAGSNYRYQVIAKAGTNSSAASSILHAWTNLTPPTLTVTPASSTSLTLNWDPQPGETNYTAEVSTTGIAGTYTPIPAATGLAANTITYTHTGLALDTVYCYKVKAYSTEAIPPPPVYSPPVCKTTPPSEPVITLTTTELDSSYTVLQDVSKYWGLADYFIGQPVVITSGGNTYTRRIAGSVNSAVYASPAFATETINQGDSYVILQTVSGKATGNDSGVLNSLLDSEKNWSLNEWLNFKIRILNSVNATNIGQERTIGLNGSINPYTTANFNAAIVAGDTYQIASYFGTATAAGSTTQLVHSGNSWGANTWSGYYLMMTSGANNGHARRITAKTTTTLTTDPFPYPTASGDTYLIAPPARAANYFGTATGAGSSTTQLVDTVHVWQTSYVGSYLVMTSGSNVNNVRLITAGFDSGGKLTVAPPFESAIVPGDSYVIASAAQIVAYAGTAAGSPGTSTTELVDTANSWLTDWSQGYYLQMTSGSNNGQSRLITGKSASTITVSTPFGSTINATDSYMIVPVDAVSGSGKISAAISPGSASQGSARLRLTSNAVEFTSTAPGYANNYNYELLSLKNLSPLAGNFDTQFDYSVSSGLIPADSSLAYLYLASTYAASRIDFQSPPGKSYQSQVVRGRIPLQDTGRSTAWSATVNTLYDTRTMAGSATSWKGWWATDQWKDYYLQMTSGPNNQLVRKITGNTAGSITLESPFPNDPAASAGTAAASGNSATKLVDSVATGWSINKWQNYYLHMASGANAGQTRRITASDASSMTVEGTGFTSPIGSGDAYRIFAPTGDSYRINVIAGTAAVNGSTQDGKTSTNALLVDSSDTIGSSLPAKNWSTNQWQGFHLYLSSGRNIGQFRTITGNTANSISVDPPFPYQIASGDSYTIFDPRAAAQATEAYWVTLYDPVATVNDTRIFPTSEPAGKIRSARSGATLSFYTAPAAGGWQLRRQLDLSAGDLFTPSSYWIYQLGRLPHTAGTTVTTGISNAQFTVPSGTGVTANSSYWNPEVGHNFRRLTLGGNPVEVSWDRLATALLYEVERCQSSNNDNPTVRTVNTGTCTTFTMNQPTDGSTRMVAGDANNGLVSGYTYRFRVRAKYNATDYTAWSNEQWLTITPPAPVLVAPAAGTASTSQLTPTWNNVAGDNGYKLYWKVRGGASCSDDSWSGPLVLGMNTTTYNHLSLTPGTYYCYKVAATGPSGPPVTPDSASSNIVSQTTKPSAPGVITFSGITTSSITLSWPQVTGNTGYQIDRSLDNSTWTNGVGSVGQDVTTYTSTGLSPGTLYYFRVSANSAAGFSATSAVQSTTTTAAAPVITAGATGATQATLSWPLVKGASSYKIERSTGGGGYSQIDDVALPYSQQYCGSTYPTVACPTLTPVTAGYADNGLTPNTTYCYQMRAWNSTGGNSAYSAQQCVTTPLMVTSQNLIVTPLNAFVVRLDWTPAACTPGPCSPPEGFAIERMIRDGVWVQIATVGAATTSFTDRRGIDPMKPYRYRLRSFSGQSWSLSAEGMAYTPPYKSGDNVGP